MVANGGPHFVANVTRAHCQTSFALSQEPLIRLLLSTEEFGWPSLLNTSAVATYRPFTPTPHVHAFVALRARCKLTDKATQLELPVEISTPGRLVVSGAVWSSYRAGQARVSMNIEEGWRWQMTKNKNTNLSLMTNGPSGGEEPICVGPRV